MTLNISIVDWWPELYPNEKDIFPVFKYLREKYNAQVVGIDDNPDLMICSFFDINRKRVWDKYPTLMVSCENLHLRNTISDIDMSGVDYLITTNFPSDTMELVPSSV